MGLDGENRDPWTEVFSDRCAVEGQAEAGGVVVDVLHEDGQPLVGGAAGRAVVAGADRQLVARLHLAVQRLRDRQQAWTVK